MSVSLSNYLCSHSLTQKGSLPIHMALLGRRIDNQERLRQHAIDHPLDICYFEGGTWHPYDQSNAMAASLELGEGSAYCALVSESGSTYIVDFRAQLQVYACELLLFLATMLLCLLFLPFFVLYIDKCKLIVFKINLLAGSPKWSLALPSIPIPRSPPWESGSCFSPHLCTTYY